MIGQHIININNIKLNKKKNENENKTTPQNTKNVWSEFLKINL